MDPLLDPPRYPSITVTSPGLSAQGNYNNTDNVRIWRITIREEARQEDTVAQCDYKNLFEETIKRASLITLPH